MKFLRQLFTNNLGLKLFSLMLAFVIWRVITSEDIAEAGFTIPLELRNIPAGSEVVGDVVNSVNVRVRSTSQVLKRLSGADMFAFLDLTSLSLGEHTYPLTNTNIQAPTGVDVVRIVPTHVKLRLERTASRTVAVKVRWRGDLDGIAELVPIPAQIQIDGPESHVNEVAQVNTDFVDLKSLPSGRKMSVALAIEDPTIRLSQETVTVQAVPPTVPPGRMPIQKSGLQK